MIRIAREHGARAAALLSLAVLLAACGSTRAAGGAAEPQPDNRTDSRATATAEEFEDIRATRVEDYLEGRFAGVNVIRRADGSVSVLIRGAGSLNGSNEPLYVIDGVPLSSPGGLRGINPQDIAKIEVLKDAGATAIYGVRGANGVVLITTKR